MFRIQSAPPLNNNSLPETVADEDEKSKPQSNTSKPNHDQQANDKNMQKQPTEATEFESQKSNRANKEMFEKEENRSLQSKNNKESNNNNSSDIERSEFNPVFGEKVGAVNIPFIDLHTALFEGNNFNTLQKGLAHYSNSAWPSDQEQIILFGKYESVGYRIKECRVNHMIVLNLPYGDFHYTITKIEKVQTELVSISRYLGKEQLLLIMSDFNHPNEQYILLADPVQT